MARKTAENPLAIVLPIILAVVGAGAAATYFIVKKKKVAALLPGVRPAVRPGVPPTMLPGVPPGVAPPEIPPYEPPREPKPGPAQQWQQTVKKVQDVREIQKVVDQAAAAARFFKPAAKPAVAPPVVTKPPVAPPIIIKPPSAAPPSAVPPVKKTTILPDIVDSEGNPLGPPEDPPEEGKPAKKPTMNDASKAAGGVAAAKTGAAILGVGLGTIAIVAVIVVVVIAAVEAIRTMQRQLRKMRKEIHSWDAMSNSFANQIKNWDKKEIPEMKEAIIKTDAQIVRLQKAVKAVKAAK